MDSRGAGKQAGHEPPTESNRDSGTDSSDAGTQSKHKSSKEAKQGSKITPSGTGIQAQPGSSEEGRSAQSGSSRHRQEIQQESKTKGGEQIAEVSSSSGPADTPRSPTTTIQSEEERRQRPKTALTQHWTCCWCDRFGGTVTIHKRCQMCPHYLCPECPRFMSYESLQPPPFPLIICSNTQVQQVADTVSEGPPCPRNTIQQHRHCCLFHFK